jgi:hypothetical protein
VKHTRMTRTRSLIGAIITVAALFPAGASATTIVGSLFFSGDVTLTTDDNPMSPTFGDGTLTFDPVMGQSYDFTVDDGMGFFSGLTGGGDAATFGAANAPVSTTPNVNIPFLTFVNSPVTFSITNVFPGVDGTGGCSDNVANEANGNICTPAGTPFNLQDIAPDGTDSSATFVVYGNLISGGMDTPATITFTASSTGKSLEQLLFDQEHGTADVITYGAQLQTIAPEPATHSLMLAACFLLAGSMFRRRKTR